MLGSYFFCFIMAVGIILVSPYLENESFMNVMNYFVYTRKGEANHDRPEKL